MHVGWPPATCTAPANHPQAGRAPNVTLNQPRRSALREVLPASKPGADHVGQPRHGGQAYIPGSTDKIRLRRLLDASLARQG